MFEWSGVWMEWSLSATFDWIEYHSQKEAESPGFRENKEQIWLQQPLVRTRSMSYCWLFIFCFDILIPLWITADERVSISSLQLSQPRSHCNQKCPLKHYFEGIGNPWEQHEGSWRSTVTGGICINHPAFASVETISVANPILLLYFLKIISYSLWNNGLFKWS